MQKFFLFLFLCFSASLSYAAPTQVINLTTAGTLSQVIDADVNDLTVTGKINRVDFETMKNTSLLGDLEHVDISGCVIEACDIPDGVDEGNQPQYRHYGSDTIPFQAFVDCNYLKSIKLPSSAVLVESYAFRGCTRLTTIDIPA
jgi:hypothetical protein